MAEWPLKSLLPRHFTEVANCPDRGLILCAVGRQRVQANNKLIEEFTAIQMCSHLNLSAKPESRVDLHASFLLLLPRIMGPCAKTNTTTRSGRGRELLAFGLRLGRMPPVFRRSENSKPV